MRSGSGPGTFFAATYLLKAATLKPSFFAACRMDNELIGNTVPDNLSDVKRSSEYNRVVAKDVIHISEGGSGERLCCADGIRVCGSKGT
jgi:hypothetical protein